MQMMRNEQQRQAAQQVIEYCQRMLAEGLTRATGGNISVRVDGADEFAISPSGLAYSLLTIEDIPILNTEGEVVVPAHEGRVPSCEWGMHLAAYQQLPQTNAVVHAHSVYATTLACMEKALPPIHYLVCTAGESVPCIPYYPFGSEALARAAAEALDARHRAVLLGHHGLLACGSSIDEAFSIATHVEFCAQLYVQALSAGIEPAVLQPQQVDEAIAALQAYGTKPTYDEQSAFDAR